MYFISIYLCNDLWIRVKFEEPPGKFGSSSVVIGLCEYTDSATQSNLYVGRLHMAMREICGQLQTSAHIVGIRLGNAPSL